MVVLVCSQCEAVRLIGSRRKVMVFRSQQLRAMRINSADLGNNLEQRKKEREEKKQGRRRVVVL